MHSLPIPTDIHGSAFSAFETLSVDPA